MNDFSYIDDDYIDECIKTGELQLTDDEKGSHFAPIKYFVIAPIIFFVFGLYNIITKGISLDINSSGFGLILASFGFLLIIFYLYRIQKKALQFFSFESDLPINEKRKVINIAGEKIHWDKVLEKENIIIGNTSNIFLWGERITVILHGDTVMINSISDPYKKTNIFAPNYKHINAFVDEFNSVEHQIES